MINLKVVILGPIFGARFFYNFIAHVKIILTLTLALFLQFYNPNPSPFLCENNPNPSVLQFYPNPILKIL